MNCVKFRWLSVLFILYVLSFSGNGYTESRMAEIRYVPVPPVIDGNMDDPAWKQADILTGFTTPGNYEVVKDRSEARIVFDSNRIYISLKAYESNLSLMSRAVNVFSSESFEVFIRPEPDKEVYYQVAVSLTGQVYTGRIKGEWSPRMEVKTSVGDDSWIVELSVPFSDLGMSVPQKDTEIKFNIVRNDWADPARQNKRKPVYSSFSLLDIADFHMPELWSAAVMTRKQGEPATVINEPPFRNLLENSDFDQAKNNIPVGWSIPEEYWKSGDVERRETLAMSGEWVIAAKGRTYVIMSKAVELKPGGTYTVRVKARKSGNAALGILQGLTAGKTAGILWNCELTGEFGYYNATFTAREGINRMGFYRIAEKTETNVIEIASVELFEGKLSAFEIRRHIPRSLSAEVAGTALPMAPNFYGAHNTAGRLRVLAISYSLFTSREFLQVFAGLDIDADILTVSGNGQDIYYTLSDPAVVKERIEDAEYDLYIVGRVAVEGVGKELARKIFANVEKGAGLVIHPAPGRKEIGGNFVDIMTRYGAKSVPSGHYLRRGLPAELYPGGEPVKDILVAEAGKGKIVVVNTGMSWNLQLRVPREVLNEITFPYQRYSNAWLARMFYYAAGRTVLSIGDVQIDNGRVSVRLDGNIQPSSLEWQVEDKNGNRVSRGLTKVDSSDLRFGIPGVSVAGDHVLAMWLKDGKGAVIDYSVCTFRHDGPEIEECKSAKEFYTGGEEGEFKLKIKGVSGSMTVGWALEDFSGRILESGSLKAKETVSFRVPLESVYTNLARLWIRLQEGDKCLDARRLAVYLPGRDSKRLLNDFSVAVWPEGNTNPDGAPYINRTLEEIGVRAKNFSWCELSLNDGLGTTTTLGNIVGRFFNGKGTYKNNTRQPSLKDPGFAGETMDRVREQAVRDLKYGPFAVQVVDEPDLTGYIGDSMVEIDADPGNLKIYRERMKNKYGTIEKFNERCSTNYGSFDELGLVLTADVRKRENFAEFIEWRNYMVDTWVEAFRLVSDTYHSSNPGVPVSMENSFGQTAMNGNDYWKLLTRAGLDFSNEYTDAVHNTPMQGFTELYRSFRPDMRVWGYIGYSFDNEASMFKPWWFALHRFGGLSFYDTAGAEPGSPHYNLVSVPGFGMSKKGELLKKGVSGLLDGAGKIFLEYEWEKRDIAVLYSQPSMLVAWCRGTENTKFGLNDGSPYHDYFYSRHCIRYMLEELLYQYDFISPEQIDGNILNSYKVLVMPHIEALSDANLEKIGTFIARGGTVITDIAPAGYDELGTPRRTSPFRDGAVKNPIFFGETFNDKNVSQREKITEILRRAGVRPILVSDETVGTFGREAMHFVKGDMNVYAITRDYRRSSDEKAQTFVFPTGKGHIYDVREGTYLGETDRVTCAIPRAGTKVYGSYPYRITGIKLIIPSRITGGKDLVADIGLTTSAGEAGCHIFHVEVLPPSGEAGWLMKRNVTALSGKALFRFRMAENDPAGEWTLRVKDVMTGMTAEKKFVLDNKHD